MPYTRIWVHIVWSTKNRMKLIQSSQKDIFLSHISENALHKEIHIDTINCTDDHIHILLSLSRDQTLSKVVQLIKGESSCWWNKHQISAAKFEWQEEFLAVSVSHSMIDKIRKYIKNQEEHHRVKSFSEEYNEFLLKYNFTIGG